MTEQPAKTEAPTVAVTPEDQAAAEAEVQAHMTQAQIQALYGALVVARAEIAALRRALAESGE